MSTKISPFKVAGKKLESKRKLARATEVLRDIRQVLADAAAHNAALAPGETPLDPDPDGNLASMLKESQLRVDSEVWRKRARRRKI